MKNLNDKISEIKIKLIRTEGKNAKIENLIQSIPKDYEEMQSKIWEMQSEIRRMRVEIKALKKCHIANDNREIVLSENGEELVSGEFFFTHDKETCDTEHIKSLALEELARYVLDGKSIVREEMVKKEYKPQQDKIKKQAESEKK